MTAMPSIPPLFGSYSPPPSRVGRRVWCAYRGKWCRLVGRTAARLPWPRCQPLGQRGGAGVWVNPELERAIRTESAAALAYWFGVSQRTVWLWRAWAGVGGRAATPGTREAMRAAATGRKADGVADERAVRSYWEEQQELARQAARQRSAVRRPEATDSSLKAVSDV